MKISPRFSKLRVENLEERTLLAVMAGGPETAVRTVASTESAVWVVNTLEDSLDWTADDDVVSLREAIERSAEGDTIIFDESISQGKIVLCGNRLEIPWGITIDASGVGGITVDGNQKSGCFVIITENTPAELINLTITNGLEEHDSDEGIYGGAGITFLAGTLMMKHCSVRNNSAYGDGGGLYQYSYNSGSRLFLIDCVISDNRARNGGGIYQGGGDLVMTNCSISRNQADENGGGFSKHKNCIATITDCAISDNSTVNCGGGIYQYGYLKDYNSNSDSSIFLTNCTISNNRAKDGAGIHLDCSCLSVTNCSVTGNNADEEGGGIYSWYAEKLTLSNCVISANSANDGGGIYSWYTRTTESINCTISGNMATNTGGGIYYINHTTSGFADKLVNCIVSLNYANNDADIFNWNVALSNNNIIGVDPGFRVAPVFNSGRLINCETLNLSLSETSFVIDRGDNSVVKTETDLAGAPRIVSSWKPKAMVDIGAYEYQGKASVSVITVTTAEDIVDESDNLISLREAVQDANNGDIIIFDKNLSGQDIALNDSGIVIDKVITIDASGVGGVTIDVKIGSVYAFQVGSYYDPYPKGPIELIGLTVKINQISDYPDTGGIINSGTLCMTDCSVIGNVTDICYVTIGGGGINNSGVLTMTDCIVSGFSVCDYAVNGGGGGIYNQGLLTMTNCTVTRNSAIHAGGIYNSRSLTMTNCKITENIAGPDFGDGYYSGVAGGIFNAGTLIMHGCAVTNNVVNSTFSSYDYKLGSGGGICNYRNNTDLFLKLVITESVISGNTSLIGGAIYFNDNNNESSNEDEFSITNCCITDNSAYIGGGIFVYECTNVVTIENCTIARNSANYYGGGIYNYEGITCLYNTIVAQNAAKDSGNDLYAYSRNFYACNTLSTFTHWKESKDCFLYNPDKPLFKDATNGDYTLANNSQAIDKGSNDYLKTETDLAGNKRIANGIVDIGAYEYGSAPLAEQLASPTILTGNHGVYVSAGANRHQIRWNGFENVSVYELQYSADGSPWTTVWASDPVAVVTGLTYGKDVKYRVRALGDGISYTDSDWSAVKVFKVCPMDVDGDGDITGGDRALLVNSWLSEEGEEEYLSAADIDGDGNVSGGDRAFLSNNWLMDLEEEELRYPAPLAAEAIFAEFASADLGVDRDVF